MRVLHTIDTSKEYMTKKVAALLSQKIQNLHFLFHMSVRSNSVITMTLRHYEILKSNHDVLSTA